MHGRAPSLSIHHANDGLTKNAWYFRIWNEFPSSDKTIPRTFIYTFPSQRKDPWHNKVSRAARDVSRLKTKATIFKSAGTCVKPRTLLNSEQVKDQKVIKLTFCQWLSKFQTHCYVVVSLCCQVIFVNISPLMNCKNKITIPDIKHDSEFCQRDIKEFSAEIRGIFLFNLTCTTIFIYVLKINITCCRLNLKKIF